MKNYFGDGRVREIAREMVNLVARPFGLRVVNARWGPRGFADCFLRAKRQGFTPLTVIDIGASDGRWSRECMRVFPEATYFLIDPLPEHAEALRKFVTKTKRSMMWEGALGARPGRLLLNLHGHQSSIYASREFAGEQLPVEVRTLDSFYEAERFPGPLLVKADVQGYELEVLRGAVKTLAETELLLLEVSFRRIYENCPLAHEVIAYVGGCGFRIYDVCSYVQRPHDNELVQADIVFVREGSRLFSHEGWS